MTVSVMRSTLRGAFLLLAFTVVGTLMLAYTFELTRGPIARSEERARLALLNQVIPAASHDNDLLADTVTVPADPLLGTSQPGVAYRARLKGEPVAVAFEAIAPDGYSGRITLLVAVRANGELMGVRVVSHSETPGLGDYIDAERSDWIRGFDGRALTPENEQGWKVKKDGGAFDFMTGATITPRAVVKAARRALEYFQAHREQLLAGQETLPRDGQ